MALSPAPANVARFVAKGTGNAKQSCHERGNREAPPFSGPSGFAVGAIVKSPLFFWLTAFTLLIALTVGGATRQGLGSDAIPELVSLPLLAMALPRAWPSLKRSRSALALVIGVVGVALSAIGSAALLALEPLARPPIHRRHFSDGRRSSFVASDIPHPRSDGTRPSFAPSGLWRYSCRFSVSTETHECFCCCSRQRSAC